MCQLHFISFFCVSSIVPQCQTALCLVPAPHLHQLQQCVSQVPQRHEGYVSRYRPYTSSSYTILVLQTHFRFHISVPNHKLFHEVFISFCSHFFYREPEALWEAALAARLVPEGGGPLQSLEERARARRRDSAQAAHQAGLVLLETPVLLSDPHLLRMPLLGLEARSQAWGSPVPVPSVYILAAGS